MRSKQFHDDVCLGCCGVDLVSKLSFSAFTTLVEKFFMSVCYGCPLLELFVLFYFIIILWLVRGKNKGERKGGFDDGYF